MTRRHAFTLIELLFVVAIIAVLAAIAVPNFLEAQTRSKIARAQTDQAILAASLGAYYADHRAWPPNSPDVRAFFRAVATIDSAAGQPTPPGSAIPWNGADLQSAPAFRSVREKFGYYTNVAIPPLVLSDLDLFRLTTPVAYLMHSLPTDGFANSRNFGYAYINFADLMADLGLTSPDLVITNLWPTGAPVAPAISLDPFMGPPAPPIPPAPAPGTIFTTSTVTLAARSWAVLSTGPSLNFSFSNPLHGPYTPYSPNNGTVSAGEIWRTGD